MDLADIDGDGLADAVYATSNPQDAGNSSLRVRRNHGRGFGPDEKIAGTPWKTGLGLGDPGRRIADFDGDSAADVLTFGEVDASGTPTVRLHLSRGTRPMVDADLGFESGFMNPQGGWTTSKLGDFDGDGLTDVVSFVQTGTWSDEYSIHPMLKLRVLRQNRSYPLYSSDRLLSISDEGNPLPAVEVFYASKDAIAPASPGTCTYPQRCLQQPFLWCVCSRRRRAVRQTSTGGSSTATKRPRWTSAAEASSALGQSASSTCRPAPRPSPPSITSSR